VKFACIARLRDEFPVRLMCRLLGVSRAGFYVAQGRAPSARARADQRLRVEIRAAYQTSKERYGAPKIHADLRARGTACGRHRVARLMREDGLRGCRPHPFRVTTTQSDHHEPIAPNVLARRFAPEDNRERDRAWVADITYLPTAEGWLYLAPILDLASRRVVGWCAAPHLGQSLTLGALAQALALRRPRAGLLHHSDRGAQYAGGAYQALLRRHGAICSMSRAGNCWDNAVMESFFATLKTELVHGARWATRAAACRDLTEYIDRWYNHQRRHAALGYRSPVEYERALARLRSA
jgi:putative transposase